MTHSAFLAGLSLEEERKVEELEGAVAHLLKDSAALQAFCSKACYVRFLRARSWNVHKATKMLSETLKWRASYKPEQIRWEDVAHEARDGKMWVMEHPDREGRPVVIMRPRNETSHNNETRIKYLVYTLEQASRLADEWAPDAMLCWLVDFQGYSRKNAPPIKVALQTLHILQNHYPERLGKAVSYIPPLIFDLLWRAVSPFIDPVTHRKLVFINKKGAAAGELDSHFEVARLDDSLGGPVPEAAAFDPAALEARYRAADAAVERELLALVDGAASPGTGVSTPGRGLDAGAGASATASARADSSTAAPSAGFSGSSTEEGSEGSVAGGRASGAGELEATSSSVVVAGGRSSSPEGAEEEGDFDPSAAAGRSGAVEEAAVGLQALKVA